MSAVDKDEMAYRQHFTFNLAPEVAHNHNFSLKDNRGRWPLKYFLHPFQFFAFSPLLFDCFPFLFPFFSFASLTVSSSAVSFSLSLPLSLRLDQSITRWRLTVPCRNQQVLWISHAHECTHVLRAVLIAVGSLSVCTYIFGGQLIELSFVSSERKMKKKGKENEVIRRTLL